MKSKFRNPKNDLYLYGRYCDYFIESEQITEHKKMEDEMRKSRKLKLYIWGGIGFAVARSKEEAIEAIHKVAADWEWDSYAGELLRVEPEVHEPPYGGWISGGG